MDAFFASVEQRDFPEYRGKPIVVGGLPEGRGGVVATASYEARKFGIHSAMPSKTAQRLCPETIFVFPRFDVYKKVSKEIHEIFHRYTDIVEPLSLDEAYLDVTEDKQNIGYAIEIAKLIKQSIKKELNLTASAGISINKFVAKIASNMNKPNGLTFIGPSKVEAFMETLAVDQFFGVGKITAGKMKALGIHTGSDLKKLSEVEIVRYFGKPGKFYYQIVRGIDSRPVQTNRETKSVSVEDTYQDDLTSKNVILEALKVLTERLTERLQRNHLKGRTVTVKFKFHDFTIMTRSRTSVRNMDDLDSIFQIANAIINDAPIEAKRVRLLGIGMSKFETLDNLGQRGSAIQLELF